MSESTHGDRSPFPDWAGTWKKGIFVGWLKSDGEQVKAGEPFSVWKAKRRPRKSKVWKRHLRIPPDGPNEGDKVTVGAMIGYWSSLASRLL